MNGLLRELKMKSKRAKWLSLGQEDIVLVQSCFSSEELFQNITACLTILCVLIWLVEQRGTVA